MKRLYVFLINLVQDVAVCRPIVEFTRTHFEGDILVVFSSAFAKRDATGLWAAEIKALAAAFGATVVEIANASDILQHLKGGSGLIIAGSETDLPAHQINNDVFRICPSSFITVTLQHGFECPGFLHNAAHDRAHGTRIGFGANIIVGWFPPDYLYSVAPSEREKIFVAGPPMLLSAELPWPPKQPASRPSPSFHGLICENLHSVRLRQEDTRASFIDTFREFALDAADIGGLVEIRPHPGGRFTERNNIEFPASVVKNAAPFYKQDLSTFSFSISAPSSVLFDLIFADVPVAVWQNGEDSIDLSNYAGLPVIRHGADWWSFATRATGNPEPYRLQQRAFIDSLQMPADIPGRYRALLAAGA